MSKQIHTGIYHIPIDGIDVDVAHIYEHLIIQTFRRSLEDHGYSKYLFGWVSGHTFKDVLFIEYGMYNPEVEKAFKKFMSKPQRINYAFLDNELLRVQAEEKMSIDTLNKDALLDQLRRLDSMKFLDHEQDIDTLYTNRPIETQHSNIISMRKSRSKFQEITVTVGARNMTAEEKLAFLRLSPILHEAIDNCLFALGSYANESSWAIDKPAHSGMLVAAIHTIRRNSYTKKQLEESLLGSISALTTEIKNHPKELRHYISGFLTTPNWNSFPVDYFRNTGIITSKRNIAKSLTLETITTLMSKIEVAVSNTNQGHWNLM